MPNVLTTDSVTANHAEGIGQIYGGGDRSQIIWTKEDFAKFYATAPIHIADFVKGTELFGFRRGDLVEAPLDADKGHTFEFVTGKSRRGGRKGVRKVIMPILPEAREFLEELKTRPRKENVTSLFVNSKGTSWTADGLTSVFIPERDAAGIVDEEGGAKHFHDIRGTFATRLMEAGLDDKEIASLMGWSEKKTERIRRAYVDQRVTVMAIGKRLSDAAVKRAVKSEE